MSSDYIISVTESSFEYDVIAYSQNKPVVVDFWADWCKPCKIITPFLERLVIEAEGEIRLAMVDVDANPNLPLRFSVHTIPTVIAFSQGRRVSEFAGVIPESRIREFIKSILPPQPSDLLAQKGNSLLSQGDVNGAEEAFLQALDLNDQHPASMLGIMKVNILQGKSAQAMQLYRTFPASLEYNDAEQLVPLMKAMENFQNNKLPKETDLDVAFITAKRLAVRGNIYASIDGILDILRQDKKYRKDRAKEVLLGLLELLDPEGEQTRNYRAELAAILF